MTWFALWTCAVLIHCQTVRSGATYTEADDVHHTELCLSGESFGGRCFGLQKEPESYNSARRICHGQGGRLVITRDKTSAELLTEFIGKSSIPNVYIGLDDQLHESTFVWSDGTNLTAEDYTNWAQNGQGQKERREIYDCVMLDSQMGTWTAVSCNDRRAFVCEFGDFYPGMLGQGLCLQPLL